MTKAYLLAAALVIATAPAFAKDAKPADTPRTEASRADAASTAIPRVKRYCVFDTTTGSRIARKTCRTREAWLTSGFDPLAK